MATYMVQKRYYDITVAYDTAYGEVYEATLNNEEEAMQAGRDAVIAEYKENDDMYKWLWVKNVFVGDNWKNPIPSYEEFTSTGFSGLRVPTDWVGTDAKVYEDYMSVLLESEENQGWNGYLIMPILTILVTLGSQLIMKQPTPPAVDGDVNSTKAPGGAAMKFIMPAMMGFFALFYSSAFTIYLLVSQLFSLAFQAIFNLITGIRDKKEDEYIMTHTYK